MKNKSFLKSFGIMALLTFLLTWLIPSTTIGSEGLVKGNIAGVGFADIFSSIEVLTYYFIRPAIFVLFVGMFYGVINKGGVLETFTDKVSSMFESNKNIFIILSVLFYVLLSSLTGMYFVLFMFMPLSFIILEKLDVSKLKQVMIVTLSPTIGIMSQITDNLMKKFSTADNKYLLVKIVLLLVLTVFEILYLIKIGDKKTTSDETDESEDEEDEDSNLESVADEDVEESDEGSEEEEEESEEEKTHNLSFTLILGFLLIIFILGLTPWKDASIFEKAYDTIKNVKIKDFAILSQFLGTFEVFGSWSFVSLYPTIFFAIIVMSFAQRMKFKDVVDGCIEGAKKYSGIAVLSSLLYLILVFTLNSGFMATIVNFIAKGGNIALVTLSSIVATPFMVDFEYAGQYLLQLYSTIFQNSSVVTIKDMLPLYGVIVELAYGFAMMLFPSSLLLMVGLMYTNETYNNWLKYIYRFILGVFVLMIIAILVATMI